MSEFMPPSGRQAILPETLDVFRIEDMQVDDVRYARPYAMRFSEDRLAWLDSSHPTSAEYTSTMPMMVTKTLEGFSVIVSEIPEAGWDTEYTEDFDDSFGTDMTWYPVVGIYDDKDRC